MMQNRQVLINAIMSVVQVVVFGVVLFVLYRFLLGTIGIEQLGIWSVVLATTSVASIANLGLSASVVKFVAKYLARGEDETVVDVIQTAALSIGVLFGFILLVAYPFVSWLFTIIVPASELKTALSILPYALASLWLIVISSVFRAGLDGYQRIDLRSILLIVGVLFHLILCLALVPAHGLMGLAYAQVAQAGVVLIGSWSMLKKHIPILPFVPYQWNRKLFREMLGYGLNFQVISISQLLYDPITKALLTKFGGLAMTGFYEMASRMILQFRALLVSANQVLVPTIADLQEKSPRIIQNVYKDSYRLLFYIALPLFSGIVAFIPVISQAWFGHYENIFVLFSILLAIGWFLNILSVPAYFANLGIGELHWNTISHVITAVLNIGLGLLLGSIYGGIAVVVAWVFSLITGSLIVPISYHYRHKIPIAELLPRESKGIGWASLAGLFISLLFYYQLNSKLTPSLTVTIVILAFFAIVVIPIWQHPMRKRLVVWVSQYLVKAEKVV